jgi:hypothetical protein
MVFKVYRLKNDEKHNFNFTKIQEFYTSQEFQEYYSFL